MGLIDISGTGFCCGDDFASLVYCSVYLVAELWLSSVYNGGIRVGSGYVVVVYFLVAKSAVAFFQAGF